MPNRPARHLPRLQKHFRVPTGHLASAVRRQHPFPILVVDRNMTVSLANAKAYEILGKSPEDVNGYSQGQVFECSYSRLPEGCGAAVCCSGCTIRHTVTQTFRTRRTQQNVPATLKRDESTASLQITTLRAGEFVLLRVDGFQAE